VVRLGAAGGMNRCQDRIEVDADAYIHTEYPYLSLYSSYIVVFCTTTGYPLRRWPAGFVLVLVEGEWWSRGGGGGGGTMTKVVPHVRAPEYWLV
jgi:hypothetical protein